jgi:hypothetical protein
VEVVKKIKHNNGGSEEANNGGEWVRKKLEAAK